MASGAGSGFANIARIRIDGGCGLVRRRPGRASHADREFLEAVAVGLHGEDPDLSNERIAQGASQPIQALGLLLLKDKAARLEGMRALKYMDARAMSGKMPPDAVRHAMQTLKTSLMLDRGTWPDEDVQRARRINEQAAHDSA